MTTWTCCHRW